MRQLWKPQTILPPDAQLASFRDTSGETRFGHVIGDYEREIRSQKQFQFVPLIPTVERRKVTAFTGGTINRRQNVDFQIERVRTTPLANSGDPLSTLDDRKLRSEGDFLDYCLYSVLRELEADQSVPLFVYVDDVVADVRGGEFSLDSLRSEAAQMQSEFDSSDARIDRDISNELSELRDRTKVSYSIQSVFESFVQRKLDLEEQRRKVELEAKLRTRFSERERKLSELDQELASVRKKIATLRTIADQENRLTGEIRTKLVRANLPLVERSDRAREILRNKRNGDFWYQRKPAPLPRQDDQSPSMLEQEMAVGQGRFPGDGTVQLASFQPANNSHNLIQSGLANASHVLLTEIRTVDDDGDYQLSMRLINAMSGVIIWEEQGDRTRGRGGFFPGRSSRN